jgi:hypothetical protein
MKAPITAPFSIDSVQAATSPRWIFWTSYAVRAVKITTPNAEIPNDSQSQPMNMLTRLATMIPTIPMNRYGARPVRFRFVTAP